MRGFIRLTIIIMILVALWQWLEDELHYDNPAYRKQAGALKTDAPRDDLDLDELES